MIKLLYVCMYVWMCVCVWAHTTHTHTHTHTHTYIYIYIYILQTKQQLCGQQILYQMLTLGSDMVLRPKHYYHESRTHQQYPSILPDFVFLHRIVGMLNQDAASSYNPLLCS